TAAAQKRQNDLLSGRQNLARRWRWLYGTGTTAGWGAWCKDLLRAPLKRAERDSAANTAKRDVFPMVNRKNASGTFSARCMTMHET
ncbi:hypothetical protein BLX59_01585, partial [Salmonella enterica subsp. enterica serovar Newport]